MNPDYSETIPKTDWSKVSSCCDGGRCAAPIVSEKRHTFSDTRMSIEVAQVPPGVEVVTSKPRTGVTLEDVSHGSRAFRDTLEELWHLHCKKGFDYGTDSDSLANIRASKAHGVEPYRYAMLRADEKMTRYKSFLAKGSLRNEPLEETLLDLASQAILALVLLRE